MNSKFNYKFLLTVLWGFGLAAVSWFSAFSVRGSVGQVSLEIATMLTPAGMVRIFFSKHHWLRPYYAQKVLPGGFFEHPALVISFLFFIGVSIAGLILFRRDRHDRH